MRPIEFRGLRTDGKGWVYGDLIQPHQGNPDTFIALNNGHIKSVWPESVGQFTGLYDRNGVKVFEGDVVRVHGRGGEFWTGASIAYHSPSFKLQKDLKFRKARPVACSPHYAVRKVREVRTCFCLSVP